MEGSSNSLHDLQFRLLSCRIDYEPLQRFTERFDQQGGSAPHGEYKRFTFETIRFLLRSLEWLLENEGNL